MNHEMTIAPTEQDRAVARRVLRRCVGARYNAEVIPVHWHDGIGFVDASGRACVDVAFAMPALEGAALGRLYRARLRGRP